MSCLQVKYGTHPNAKPGDYTKSHNSRRGQMTLLLGEMKNGSLVATFHGAQRVERHWRS